MMSENHTKVVLIISPEAWEAHAVSKHHYAKCLANIGHTVLFLNPPDASLTRVEVAACQKQENLYVVDTPVVAKGLQYYPSFLRNFLERRWLLALEKMTGFTVDVIWLFENSRFFDLRFADDRLKIYHQVDFNQSLHPTVAAKTADICFGISDFVLEMIRPFNSRSYKVSHGYQNVSDQDSALISSISLPQNGNLNALYIGNLNIPYLDHGLIEHLVRTFDQVNFNFIGGYSGDNPLVGLSQQFSHVTLHGKIASEEIPLALASADILMILYLADDFKEQLANPHKMLEYLGSGKVVVSTYCHEYRHLDDLIVMVASNDDYSDAFDRAVTQIVSYNSLDNSARRKRYASDNSYQKQLQRIDDLLADNELGAFIFPKDSV